jgi:hypothetical protein
MIRGARAAGMDVTAMVSEVGTSSNGSSHTPFRVATNKTIIDILFGILFDGKPINANTLTDVYKKVFPEGTPLVCACEKGRVEDVEGMIRGARAAGMDVTAMVSEVGTNSDGYSGIYTPLMAATDKTIIDILFGILFDGKPINGNTLTDVYEEVFPEGTPFVCACEEGRVEDVEGMIRDARAAGMDVTAMVSEVGKAREGYSATPLMAAARNEHSTIIEILLQYNADTATTIFDGYNALHYAAWYNETTTTTVQLLLNNMKLEDINHKSSTYGGTPLDHCYIFNESSIKQQLIDLIRQKGGKR